MFKKLFFEAAFMKKNWTVFQKLYDKKWFNFYWNEIKVPHFAQYFLVTETETKNWHKLEKLPKWD